MRQTGRFYGVEEQQQPLMLHTSVLSPGVRAKEGTLAASGPPVESPGKGRLTVAEYVALEVPGHAGGGGGNAAVGRSNGARQGSAAARAASAARVSRSDEADDQQAQQDGQSAGGTHGGLRPISREDLLEGGRPLEDVRQITQGGQLAPAPSPNLDKSFEAVSPANGDKRRPPPPGRSRQPLPMSPAYGARVAAAGRNMSPHSREAALGRRAQDPRERMPKRAGLG